MNILGEGFHPNIIGQIDARQKLYATGFNTNNPRTPEFITYSTSNTSYVRLMSSVEIADPKELNSPYISTLGLTGQNLAKQAILFGGVQGLKSGISDGTSNPFNNFAYGWGAGNFGLRPMPGITSANIKSENIGSLKTATIKIKCWDRAQFEIIDTLYLRLGFYVLLEWGHTLYINNDVPNPQLINNPTTLETEFFNKKNNIDNMLSLIVKKRLDSYGNYDALFGKVVNFSWNFNKDGSYDVNVVLRSVGDIIESLKVNVFSSETNNIVVTPSSNISSFQVDNPNNIYDLSVNDKGSSKATTTPDPKIPTDPKAFKSNINFRLYSLKKDLDDRVAKNNFLKDDNVFSITTYLSDGNLQDVVKVKWNNNIPTYYIRFGALLRIIQGDVIPTINDAKSLKFDYDIESNLINYLNYQISTNPKYVLIKKEFPELDIQILNSRCADFISSIDSTDIYGKLMNVYLSYDYIDTKLDELRLTPGSKVLLIDFLQDIGKTISDCLGGVNNIVPVIDEETNTVKFIDQNLLYKKNSVINKFNELYKTQTSTTPGKFELYGYNPSGSFNSGSAGFIKDFTLQTELTPQFASMITIGAAARSKVVGEDATALSRINAGLTSSYIESYEDPKIIINLTSSILDQYKETFKNYVEFLKSLNMKNDANPPQWNEDNFKTYPSVLNSFITLNQNLTSELSSSASTTTGFIPINVSLTMTGLSGMKIYQEFTIDTNYLPSNYDREMSFLIKGVEHTIQNNTWTTVIQSLSLPKITNKPNPINLSESLPLINKETKSFDQVAIKRAYQVLRVAGYNDEQIAGIIGNLLLESRMNPLASNGSTIGIAQWRGSRKEQLKKFKPIPRTINGEDYTKLNTQLYFLISELNSTEGKAKRALLAVKTTGFAGAKEAAEVWEAEFERSEGQGLPERIGYALDIYDKIKKGQYK